MDGASCVSWICDLHVDVKTMDLRIEPTEVPAEETTYLCTAFTFPDEVVTGDFHMIGAETLIGNPSIIHHLIVYGCPDETGW